MKSKSYSGVIIPSVTPLTRDFKLDHASVEKILDLFREQEVTPFILGTTGEAASLPFTLKKDFLQLAGKLKKSGDLLYAGVSANVFSESVELSQLAFDGGVDVVVATLPSYYSLTETAMLRYFEQLADAVKRPMMIYNIPATTHMSVPVHVIDKLSHHPNIVGVKDSERSENRLSESIALWRDRDDFSYLLGWAARSAQALLQGADGLVPSTGNFDPGLYSELFRQARQGSEEEALHLQLLSDELGGLYQQNRTLGESLWALKVVMNEAGLCGTTVMPPLCSLSEDEERRLRKDFQNIIQQRNKIA